MKNSTLLIADDTAQTRHLLEALFRKEGFRVLAAGNGQEALALARAEAVDLVISDLLMPVMDGYEFCRHLKTDPGLKAIPFIVYTSSYTGSLDEELALSLGADQFIIKPVEPAVLTAAVREALGGGPAREPAWDGQPEAELAFLRQHNATLSRKLGQKAADLHKLSTAIEHSPAMVVITDREGVIEYVNPRFTEITGFTPAEAVGANPRIMKSGTTAPGVYADLWRTILAGHGWRGELRNRKKTGEGFWVSISVSPILDEAGAISHFIALSEDISGMKQAHADLQEQLAELRRWQVATLDRETRILDLKREVNALAARLGQPVRYPSAEPQQP